MAISQWWRNSVLRNKKGPTVRSSSSESYRGVDDCHDACLRCCEVLLRLLRFGFRLALCSWYRSWLSRFRSVLCSVGRVDSSVGKSWKIFRYYEVSAFDGSWVGEGPSTSSGTSLIEVKLVLNKDNTGEAGRVRSEEDEERWSEFLLCPAQILQAAEKHGEGASAENMIVNKVKKKTKTKIWIVNKEQKEENERNSSAEIIHSLYLPLFLKIAVVLKICLRFLRKVKFDSRFS